MIHPARALAALTGAATLTIVGMSPASAAYWSHDDTIGDVVAQTGRANQMTQASEVTP